ncbi:hypothetical protein C9431_08950 [Listeria monocytogenes]|nr:hypothetical protein [Listeria monocytogenes]EAG5407550.1 hypothetical protein [Listeria monocytogenes]EAG5801911.1 hypothetical protein [Listeria monocytogenes]EAG5804747.1 hypothetical protein [Listeria monocytogenes]EBF5366046.1 hypothetical protein [Listeria monocytogenes]
MREIEFRGKRIDNGEWVYGNLMQFEDSATFIFADERKGASTLTYAHFIINNMHAIDEKTIDQYTGLKDKNGKKIFEGDIVDISVYDRLSISGDIYLTRMLKGGTMSDNRRIITDECLKATASWFLSNDRKGASWKAKGDVHPHLFFTGDLNKAKRIKAILEEEVAE